MRVSDRIPALSDVPAAETGQTLAKWGIGHGAYLVLPVFGPKSLRDTVGLAGDIALSPVTWLTFGAIGGVGGATTLAFSTPDSARTLHGKLRAYDAATENTLDRYLAVRTAYSQSRKQATQR
jgi:phospholipid-binding lipoprotein MlaA